MNVSNANNLRLINAIDNAGKKPLLVDKGSLIFITG